MFSRLSSPCFLVVLILPLLSLTRSAKDDSFLSDQSLPLRAVSADEAGLQPRQICIEWKRRKNACRKRKRNLFLKRLFQVSGFNAFQISLKYLMKSRQNFGNVGNTRYLQTSLWCTFRFFVLL